MFKVIGRNMDVHIVNAYSLVQQIPHKILSLRIREDGIVTVGQE